MMSMCNKKDNTDKRSRDKRFSGVQPSERNRYREYSFLFEKSEDLGSWSSSRNRRKVK